MQNTTTKLSQLEPRFQRAFSILHKEFGAQPFKAEEAKTVLNDPNIDKTLSELSKANLLTVTKDEQDARVKLYTLNLDTSDSIIRQPTRGQLISLLKTGADLIRTSVDYRTLIIFLFYKAISDKWNTKVQENLAKVNNKKQAYLLTNTGYYKLYDQLEDKLYTWQEITKNKETINELANAIRKVAQMNPERFGEVEKLLEVVGLFGFINEDNFHILEGLVSLFDKVDFSHFDGDLLGDAYMWILHYFAPAKAKEGEVFTPKEINTLLSHLLDIQEGDKVLDPACGSGGMLIEAYQYVVHKTGKPKPVIELYGQERREDMEALAKINMILHDIHSFNFWIGDSLRNPHFPHCDHVIANPPWNLKGYSETAFSGMANAKSVYTHFVADGFPPNSTADWAWIQLMFYYATKKVAVILDSGALFRGGKEKKIRQAFLEKNYVDAVILLPEKLFYNTPASGVILVLTQNKPAKRKDRVLFINASTKFSKHPNVRKLNILPEESIRKIANTYHQFKEEEYFSRLVDLSQIQENDYNLNVSLYVAPKIEEEEIDLQEELTAVSQLKREEQKLEDEVTDILTKLVKVNR